MNAVELTPQQHGPARWNLPTIARTLKTELNGAPALGVRVPYDSTAVEVAVQSLHLYLAKLLRASQDRLVLMAQGDTPPQAPSTGDVCSSKFIILLTAELQKSAAILKVAGQRRRP